MLQSAADWWWGEDTKQSNDDDDDNHNNDSNNDENVENNDDEKSENKDEEEIDIEFEKELESISCIDPIISLFKLINFEDGVKKMLILQFSDNLTEKEMDGIFLLFIKIYNNGIKTNLYLSIYYEIKIGEIILSYFASLSPTNPDEFKCWDRWIKYRINKEICFKLKNVENKNLEKFYNTKANEIGFDNKGRLIWFVSTEKYDGYIDDDTQRKGVILLLMSFFWDLNKNKFDLNILRNGAQSHLNLSHWSINMVSWSTVNAIKDAMIAFPYSLKDIFIVNPPMFVYLVKTVAAQFFTAHSLDKFIFLESHQEYFEKFASKDKTPIIANGTSKITISQWMKQRGYI